MTQLLSSSFLLLLLTLSLLHWLLASTPVRATHTSSTEPRRSLLEVPPYVRGPDYQYFLSLEQRERGLGYLGSRSRMKAVVKKLLEGDTVHVTTVGGSVTAGLHGVGDGHSWPEYLFNFLNDTFPGQVQTTNGAVPGTISSYMSACVNIHVPRTTDLVLVEYTVNDVHHATPPFTNEYRRAYERLLRKLLAFPNRPAVVLMHSYNWMAPPVARFWSNLEREYLEFAYYYDLPSLSLKAAAFHSMVEGAEGFEVERPRHDDVDKLAGKSFFFDKIHPDALTGARAMAELAMHLVVKVRGEVAAAEGEEGGSGGGSAAAADVVPGPMIPGNFETSSDRCFIGTHFQGTIASAKGFEWLNDSRGRAPKFGYISKVAGSVLRIRIDSRASSSASGSASRTETIASASGSTPRTKTGSEPSDSVSKSETGDQDGEGGNAGKSAPREAGRKLLRPTSHADQVLVQIVHLKSYEGMGTALVTCESGCRCAESVIDGLEPSVHNSQLYLHSMYVSQAEECVLAVKVQACSKNRCKVKVAGVIVSEETGEIKGAAKTVEAVEMVHTITLQGGGAFDVRTKTVGGRPARSVVR